MNTETEQSLRHERDEARAEVAVLRGLLRRDAKFLMAMWDSSQSKTGCEIHLDDVRAALSQPNPGQPLLDRLAAAEDALNHRNKHYAHRLNQLLDIRAELKADDHLSEHVWAELMKLESRETMFAADLAAWRKFTEEAK